MNTTDAGEIARAYLCKHIQLEQCAEIPSELYGFKPSDVYLFRFKLFGQMSIGSSEYVAVTKSTGSVHYLGEHGE